MLIKQFTRIEKFFKSKTLAIGIVSIIYVLLCVVVGIFFYTKKNTTFDWILFIVSICSMLLLARTIIYGNENSYARFLFPYLKPSDTPIRDIFGFMFIMLGFISLGLFEFILAILIIFIVFTFISNQFKTIKWITYYVNEWVLLYSVYFIILLFFNAIELSNILVWLILTMLLISLPKQRNLQMLINFIVLGILFILIILSVSFASNVTKEEGVYRSIAENFIKFSGMFIVFFIRFIYSLQLLSGRLPSWLKFHTFIYRTVITMTVIFLLILSTYIIFINIFLVLEQSSGGTETTLYEVVLLLVALFCFVLYGYQYLSTTTIYEEYRQFQTPTYLSRVFGANWKLVIILSFALFTVFIEPLLGDTSNAIEGVNNIGDNPTFIGAFIWCIAVFSILLMSPHLTRHKSTTAKINTNDINDVYVYPTIIFGILEPISLHSALISLQSKELIPKEHRDDGKLKAFATLDTSYCFVKDDSSSKCDINQINLVVNCDKKRTYHVDEVRFVYEVDNDYYMGSVKLIIKIAPIQTEVILNSLDICPISSYQIHKDEYELFLKFTQKRKQDPKFRFNRLLDKYRLFKESEFEEIPENLYIAIDSRKFLLNNGQYGIGKSVFDIVSINRNGYNPLPVSLWEENYSSELLFVLHNRLKSVSKKIHKNRIDSWLNSFKQANSGRKSTGGYSYNFIKTHWDVEKKVPWLSVIGLTALILTCTYTVVKELGSLFPTLSLETKFYVKDLIETVSVKGTDGTAVSFSLQQDSFKSNLLDISSNTIIILLIIVFVSCVIILSRKAVIQYRIHKTNSTEFFQDYFLADIKRILIQKNAVIIFEDVDRMDVEGIKKVFRLASNLNKYMQEEERIVGVISLDTKIIEDKYNKDLGIIQKVDSINDDTNFEGNTNKEYIQELEKICYNFDVEIDNKNDDVKVNKKNNKYFIQLLQFIENELSNAIDLDQNFVKKFKDSIHRLETEFKNKKGIIFKECTNFRTLRKLGEQIATLDKKEMKQWEKLQEELNKFVDKSKLDNEGK